MTDLCPKWVDKVGEHDKNVNQWMHCPGALQIWVSSGKLRHVLNSKKAFHFFK